jgi:hypothetical protein
VAIIDCKEIRLRDLMKNYRSGKCILATTGAGLADAGPKFRRNIEHSSILSLVQEGKKDGTFLMDTINFCIYQTNI